MLRKLALVLAALAIAQGCLSGVPVQSASLVGEALGLELPVTDFFNRTGSPAYSGGLANGMTPVNPPVTFHTLDEIVAHVENYSTLNPGVADVQVIGASLDGLPIYDVVLTNESRPAPKPHLLLDGGHHGNEIAGTELVLYTLDFLLANQRNATVAHLLDTFEMHFVPLVNPDGYVRQTRGNALGVNLNRNYDIDWGNVYGASNPVMGAAAHATGQAVPSVPIAAENCGDAPFSEPEARAMRDLMARLHDDFAFYLTMHTPTNGLVAPWGAGDPPFELPANDSAVFEAELQWTRDHTEYAAGKAQWGNFSAGLPYSASGSSSDWAYMMHHAASYTLEVEIWVTSIVDPDYAQRVLAPYDGLDYWMKASLPIPWHMLVNADNYLAWELPTDDVPLPEGVPPPVPSGGFAAFGQMGMVKPGGEGPD
jgi:zinc carboxypeptidase